MIRFSLWPPWRLVFCQVLPTDFPFLATSSSLRAFAGTFGLESRISRWPMQWSCAWWCMLSNAELWRRECLFVNSSSLLLANRNAYCRCILCTRLCQFGHMVTTIAFPGHFFFIPFAWIQGKRKWTRCYQMSCISNMSTRSFCSVL